MGKNFAACMMKIGSGVLLALLSTVAAAAATTAHATPGIAWINDADAAFAQAAKEHKPLFLYWGAVWCPPCNQVRATIFNREDFIERSRSFVPLYVDGDTPAAQRLGARFKVSAYPTMLLLKPDGTEITRLPGEADAQQYMQALSLGMRSARPVKALLTAALAGNALSNNDWQLLASYSWDVDDGQLVANANMPATLWRLAQASPAASSEVKTRFTLKALRMASSAKQADQSGIDKALALHRLRAVLANPRDVQSNFTELVYGADTVPAYLTPAATPQRAQLLRQWDLALVRLAANGKLSNLDRLAASEARVELVKLAAPQQPMPAELLAEVRASVARADQAATDRYEREAVINNGAELLADAGLLDESDTLLKSEMQRSSSPYYYMSGLASNAKARGDKAAALVWYEKAYASARGPATRLQWGASYVRALIELAPQDNARIEGAARAVLSEIDPAASTFHARNEATLRRLSARLAEWNKDGSRSAAIDRLRAQMHDVCTRVPPSAPERASCESVLNATPTTGVAG